MSVTIADSDAHPMMTPEERVLFNDDNIGTNSSSRKENLKKSSSFAHFNNNNTTNNLPSVMASPSAAGYAGAKSTTSASTRKGSSGLLPSNKNKVSTAPKKAGGGLTAVLKRRNSKFGRKHSTATEMEPEEGDTRGKLEQDQEKRGRADRMKFPTYEELNLLPEEIRDTLMQLVLDFLRQHLYPRLLLLARRRAKKAAIAVVHLQVPLVPTSFLQQIPFFSRWTNLESIVGALELQLFDKDEILCMQNESSQSGIFFLAQGTVSVRKLRKLPDNLSFTPKGCGDHLTEQVRLLEPLSCYGETIFLTEEPRMETLRTTSRCAVWVLKHRPFFSLFENLPDDRRRDVLDNAYERRRGIMPIVFPIDEELLREAPLFSDTPIDVLQQLATRMEPRVYAKGCCICKIGQAGAEMYYVGRGSIRMSMVAVEGEEPLVSTVHPGTIVGEMGVFSTKKRNITLLCQTACDVYVMDHELISSVVNSQAIMSRILRKAHALQTEYQEHSRRHHFDWIANIPLLNCPAVTAGPGGGSKLHQAILDACEGKVYPLSSCIISVSECADRLVLITRGKARVPSLNVDLKVGEALGFTCLVPHRWTYHAVAGETVETIELPYTRLRKILMDFGVYEEVKALSLGLLYPRVHPAAFQQAITTAKDYCNPPCFPTSLDYDPKPFAARVTATIKHHHGVTSPLNKPKQRLDNLYAPGPNVPKAPVDTKHFAQEAAEFIEALDREQGGPVLINLNISNTSGGDDEAGFGSLSQDERDATERNARKEAEIKRLRAESRKRLTMDKPKHLARTRNTQEMERLSRRIRQLERQQTASVPPGAKLNFSVTAAGGGGASATSPSPKYHHRTTTASASLEGGSVSKFTPARGGGSFFLPPIQGGGAKQQQPRGGGGGEVKTTSQQLQVNDAKQSRTLAIQTDKSYLHAKSVKAQRLKDFNERRAAGVMNDL